MIGIYNTNKRVSYNKKKNAFFKHIGSVHLENVMKLLKNGKKIN